MHKEQKRKIIKKVENLVKQRLSKPQYSVTEHGWSHIQRVRRNARAIARKEKKVDLFIVELSALLHDISDWKFSNKKASITAKKLLLLLKVDEPTINYISLIIDNISFKGGTNKFQMPTIEGKIVQDADRLDALGAIGIARAIAYGGYIRRVIYDPKLKPRLNRIFTDTSINHLYEKTPLIKERMNTKTGRKLAIERHKFVVDYLKQFKKEWGK